MLQSWVRVLLYVRVDMEVMVGGLPAVWTVMSQIFVLSVQTVWHPFFSCRVCDKWSMLDCSWCVTVWGGPILHHVIRSVCIILSDRKTLLSCPLHLSFLCFHAFLGSAQQPINQQPLRDRFITMHNGWMVCKTNVRTLLCCSWSASVSASVVYHQVAICTPCSPLSVVSRPSRV